MARPSDGFMFMGSEEKFIGWLWHNMNHSVDAAKGNWIKLNYCCVLRVMSYCGTC